jgi:hypothetical protein
MTFGHEVFVSARQIRDSPIECGVIFLSVEDLLGARDLRLCEPRARAVRRLRRAAERVKKRVADEYGAPLINQPPQKFSGCITQTRKKKHGSFKQLEV